jgi:RNA recognition motif-containing protein
MKNIYVGNLNFSATEDSLRALFEKYGAVDRIHIVTDRDTGQARGFAFVEMRNDAEAMKAINRINGMDLEGRTLSVNEAHPKTDRPREGRPGGGGGRRH